MYFLVGGKERSLLGSTRPPIEQVDEINVEQEQLDATHSGKRENAKNEHAGVTAVVR